MEELHIIPKDSRKKSGKVVVSELKFDIANRTLCAYLEEIRTSKNERVFNDHETVVTRLMYTLSQSALAEGLGQYD